MTKQNPAYPTEALLKGLKSLLTSLPSEEERSELLRTLREAQSFLSEIELLVEAVPTMESSKELSLGLSRLDILAERVQRDDGLRRLLGLRGSKASRSKRVVTNGGADARAIELERELIRTDVSDIAASLEKQGEPLAVLVKLAGLLGMRTRSKERKADLIRRIASHVENQRGYRILRGDSSESTVRAVASPTLAQE
jgi:hypothetical protein